MNRETSDNFEILRHIVNKPQLTQRDLAKRLNLSLGKVNYCIKALKDKGYIKISTKTNFFGYLKILHDDLSAIITEELRNIHLHKEKTKDAKIRNKYTASAK